MLKTDLENIMREVTRVGINDVSLSSLSASLGLSKRALYREFVSKEGMIADILSHIIRDRINLGASIVNDNNLNSYEKIACYYIYGVMRCRWDSSESGVLFLFHNKNLWNKVPPDKFSVLKKLYFDYVEYSQRVIADSPKIKIKKDIQKNLSQKLSFIERGMVNSILNVFHPSENVSDQYIANLFSTEIESDLKLEAGVIDREKILLWTHNFLSNPPKWSCVKKADNVQKPPPHGGQQCASFKLENISRKKAKTATDHP
ncbi:TetR family transcriptional regulator [Ferrimonas lipolytica]|uniref:TetR family transcriptional regulator n=1 Tax=Ferrimonas lipolytica TaxID=2724191 RepID=A0A6H1UGB7_9GAMM|nr:TetR family transcriptional regulator [Ferrimonas lipolytica]QIZ78147.1 TetR family transcriptional regulator [Ferrimonas lipolytica]